MIVATAALALAGCKSKEEAAPQEPPKPVETRPEETRPAEPMPPAPPAAATKNIIEVASEAGSFKTLLTAVDAAGLTATLAGPGPFTVFAPTDEAFAKVPAKDLEALLADKEALTKVLTYHVVQGAVTAKDVAGIPAAKTLQGGELAIDTSSGVKVGGATVVKADIMASNGVIHVIDTVLMPK
ncbi:MAG: fasciclin domain-containing protein [Deltaproteobacteria bacterium]|nr:fasciclin domain-containing protein [Kofleriaceae bacterium]